METYKHIEDIKQAIILAETSPGRRVVAKKWHIHGSPVKQGLTHSQLKSMVSELENKPKILQGLASDISLTLPNIPYMPSMH